MNPERLESKKRKYSAPISDSAPEVVSPPKALASDSARTRRRPQPIDEVIVERPNAILGEIQARPTGRGLSLFEAMKAVEAFTAASSFDAVAGGCSDGQSPRVSAEDIAVVRGVAEKSLQRALEAISNSVAGDTAAYSAQRKIDDDQEVVSTVSKLLGGVSGEEARIVASAKDAQVALRQAKTFLAQGYLSAAAERLEVAQDAAQATKRAWLHYSEGVIDGAESGIEILEHTRTAAGATLGVLAIVGTGGAAGGVVSAFGVELGGAAAVTNGVVLGYSIASRTGEASMAAALGQKVDFVGVAKDIAVDIVIAKVGGRLSQSLGRKLFGHPAVQRQGAVFAQEIFLSLVSHEGAIAFKSTVDATYDKLSGRDVTWSQFADHLEQQMFDPKGLFIAALTGALQAGVQIRYGAPKSTEIFGAGGKDIGEIDLIRNKAIVEDKSAQRLLDPTRVPPERLNEATEAWAEKQIFRKTQARIKALDVAEATGPNPKNVGSRDVPTLDEVRSIRDYRFEIEADFPKLREAVSRQLDALSAQHPDWRFSARFGVTRPADDRVLGESPSPSPPRN